MSKLKSVWSRFRRGEQWILLACLTMLAFLALFSFAHRNGTPPAPPLFQDAPLARAQAAGVMTPLPDGGTVTVHIAGAVHKPGVLELPAGARVVDAVRRAGGPTKESDLNALNLAARLKDGEKIVVAQRGQAPAGRNATSGIAALPAQDNSAAGAQGGATAGSTSSTPQKRSELSQPVNVNTASAAELEALPGVGPAIAARIIAHRQQQGVFRSLEDLDQVKGLGPKKIEKMKPYVTF